MGWLCWLVIMLPFAFGTLIDLMGMPNMVKYLLDAAWCVLLIIMLCYSDRLSGREMKGLIGWVVLFLSYTLLAYLPQYQSGLYYLWGVRNNFRFYVAFLAFCFFLKPRDIDGYLNVFDKLFWVNVVVSLVQFFGLGYEQDHLGGIFGVEKGCNAYSNIFFCIVLTKSVIFYLEKREKLWQCLIKFGAAMIVAALAELKFFFVEAVLIVMLAVLFTDFSWRKVWIILAGFAAIVGGAVLLAVVFPEFVNFFSVEWFLENAASNKGYTSSGDMNRLNAIAVINERFFDSWDQRLFGLGLGNCDTSAFEFLNTPFFVKYSWLHYSWLSTAFVYSETGYIGLAIFFCFFILIYLKAKKIEKSVEVYAKPYCRMARVMTVVCALIAIYNSSLRTEAGYMAYLVLAMPFVFHNSTCKRQ